ncbi:MAG: hypothetical protein ACRD82_08385 [Blastocatellia bacterium]
MSKDNRTHVTFVTKLFNTTEEKDYFINPTCFGDDLAEWLIKRLNKVDPKPTQEDWGWCFSVEVGQRGFLVCLGYYEDDDTPSTWLVFIESRLNWFGRKLLGRSDKTDLLALSQELDHALNSDPQITHIRWHTKEDFMKGNENNWLSHPIEKELYESNLEQRSHRRKQ